MKYVQPTVNATRNRGARHGLRGLRDGMRPWRVEMERDGVLGGNGAEIGWGVCVTRLADLNVVIRNSGHGDLRDAKSEHEA